MPQQERFGFRDSLPGKRSEIPEFKPEAPKAPIPEDAKVEAEKVEQDTEKERQEDHN